MKSKNFGLLKKPIGAAAYARLKEGQELTAVLAVALAELLAFDIEGFNNFAEDSIIGAHRGSLFDIRYSVVGSRSDLSNDGLGWCLGIVFIEVAGVLNRY